jgi:oligopeptide transport system ATP-binding protein
VKPSALVTVHDLHVRFSRGALFGRREWVHALDGVSIAIPAGATLGIAGESGSGKSTLGRALVGLAPISAGTVELDGALVAGAERRPAKASLRQMQMVFQDPYASLDPRHTIGRIIAEPLRIHGIGDAAERRARVSELLGLVGLDAAFAGRRPGQLSGGQRQRVGIARALACAPGFVICDEPTSSLDVSVQAQIVNLLLRLQNELGLTYLFISHNLAVLRAVSSVVGILYLGRIVEIGPANDVLQWPRHPYTAALLSAVPVPDPTVERARRRIALPGDPPSPVDLPTGCRFHPRCPRARERCRVEDPVLAGETQQFACFYPLDREVRAA